MVFAALKKTYLNLQASLDFLNVFLQCARGGGEMQERERDGEKEIR